MVDFLLFFFKQKTAYEMRISDWSSDVCSSDLPTMTGCLMKPRTNMPHGPKKRLSFARIRCGVAIFESWACARGLVMMAFALLRRPLSVAKSAAKRKERYGPGAGQIAPRV